MAGAVYIRGTFDGYPLTRLDFDDAFTARLGGSSPTTPGTPTTPAVFIPNSITPNGDELNDTFASRNLPGINWQLSVYSRWGR